jgi:hypothetical protein
VRWAKQYAETEGGGPLFVAQYVNKMEESIAKVESAMQTLRKGSPWSHDTKVTDDFLNPLFSEFFKGLGIPNLFQKTDYHVLASLVRPEDIDAEVVTVLDKIAEVSSQAESSQ